MKYVEHEIKKKNGKVRKITAPDDELKAYQRSRIPYYEAKFNQITSDLHLDNIFHGFVKKRSPITTAEQHIGYDATVYFDLANFFDTVTKESVIAVLMEIPIKDSLLFHKEYYTAQGFPSSPVLANIALVPLVYYIKEALTIIAEDHFALTIYADDISISYNSHKTDWRTIRDLVYKQINTSPFEINTRKTRVRFSKHGYRPILGVNVGKDHIQASRKSTRKVRAVSHLVTTDPSKAQALGGLTTWQGSTTKTY